MSSNGKDPDFVGEGFHRLDPKVLDKPPKIKWGRKFESWAPGRQINYLKNFAASMNHAAYLLQQERDKLNNLCFVKEMQIEKLTKALSENNSMIQQQITRMNEEKQAANKRAAELNARIRELENGNKH